MRTASAPGFETAPGPSAPTPPVNPVEAAASPERRERPFHLEVGMESQYIGDRPDVQALNTGDRGHVIENHPENLDRVLRGKRGVYMASSAYEGQADRVVTVAASSSLRDRIEAESIDGLSDEMVRNTLLSLVTDVEQDVSAAKDVAGKAHAAWKDGEASIGAVRFFIGDDGKNKAALLGVGAVEVIRIRGEEAEVVLTPQMETRTGFPTNTVGENNRGPGSGNIDQAQIVDVQEGDRFVMVERGMRDPDTGRMLNPVLIERMGRGKDAAGAAKDLPKLAHQDVNTDPDAFNIPQMTDITVAVVDVKPPKKAWKRALDGALGLGGDVLSAPRRFRENNRQATAEARAEYQANPTRSNRLKYVALFTGGVLVSGAGAYLIMRGVGRTDDIDSWVGDHTNLPDIDMPDINLPDIDLPDLWPFDNDDKAPEQKNPDGVGPADPGEAQQQPAPLDPEIANYKLPDGTVVPDEFPKGFQMDTEDAKWLNGHTGGGELGDYDADGVPADSTGREGTLWNSALEGLKELGFDPDKMTDDERKAYVKYVMSIQVDDEGKPAPLNWESAKGLSNNYEVTVPFNDEAIVKVMEITGQDGDPLMPEHGSAAEKHILNIRDDIVDYIDKKKAEAAAGAGTGQGHDNHGNGNNNAAPAETDDDGFMDHLTSPVGIAATAVTGAVAVGGTAVAARRIVRNRRARRARREADPLRNPLFDLALAEAAARRAPEPPEATGPEATPAPEAGDRGGRTRRPRRTRTRPTWPGLIPLVRSIPLGRLRPGRGRRAPSGPEPIFIPAPTAEARAAAGPIDRDLIERRRRAEAARTVAPGEALPEDGTPVRARTGTGGRP
jgi:hypothetical protein